MNRGESGANLLDVPIQISLNAGSKTPSNLIEPGEYMEVEKANHESVGPDFIGPMSDNSRSGAETTWKRVQMPKFLSGKSIQPKDFSENSPSKKRVLQNEYEEQDEINFAKKALIVAGDDLVEFMGAMILLSWNVRGLRNLRSFRSLCKHIHSKAPNLVFLMETKLLHVHRLIEFVKLWGIKIASTWSGRV